MKIDPDKIHYRKASIDDILLLVEFRLLFLKEIQESTPQKEIVLKRELENFINVHLLENTLIAWIAEFNKEPLCIGWILLREQPPHFKLLKGKIGIILNIYTLPEYRKNGMGKEIMLRLIEEGKKQELDRLELRATADGEKLYTKLGFIVPEEKTMEIVLSK